MTSRLKIDVTSGVLEVEGEEEFVLKLYEDAKEAGLLALRPSRLDAWTSEESVQDSKTKRGGPSCAERILELVSGGFFDKPKSASEIKGGLEQNGHSYAANQVGAALTNLYQRGSLRRLKPGKEWVYQKP